MMTMPVRTVLSVSGISWNVTQVLAQCSIFPQNGMPSGALRGNHGTDTESRIANDERENSGHTA